MTKYKRLVGYQLCPRCKEKKLPIVISGLLKRDGKLKYARLKVHADSNPACMWEGEENIINTEQAFRLIEVSEAKKAEAAYDAAGRSGVERVATAGAPRSFVKYAGWIFLAGTVFGMWLMYKLIT